MTAQQPPSEEEERDIEQDDKHADGGPGGRAALMIWARPVMPPKPISLGA